MRRVKDIASHEQGIDLVLPNRAEQEVQKVAVLLFTRQVTQRLAQVPVRGVEDPVSLARFGRDVREKVDPLTNSKKPKSPEGTASFDDCQGLPII